MAESQFAKSMELSNCFGTNFAPNNFHILVVDCDVISLHNISSMLEKASFNVTTSRHAHEALAIIQETKSNFRLVIAGIATVFDSKDLYYLFLQGINSDIPVILISNTLTKALDGRSIVIRKPLNFNQLMQLVWQQFEKYSRRINNSSVVPTQIGLGGNGIPSQEIQAEGVSRLSVEEGSDRIRLIPNRSVGIRIEEPSDISSSRVSNNAPSGCIQTHDPQYYPRVYANSIKGKEVILINDEEEEDLSAKNGNNDDDVQIKGKEEVEEGLLKRKFISDWDEEVEQGQDKRFKSTPSGLLDYFKFRTRSPLENHDHGYVEKTAKEANIPGLVITRNKNYDTRYISKMLNESSSMDLSKCFFFPNTVSCSCSKPYFHQNYSFLLQNGFESVMNDFNMPVLQNPNNTELLSPENNNYGMAQNVMTLQIGQESNQNNGDVNIKAFDYYSSPKSNSKFGITGVLDEEDVELNIFAFKRTLGDSYNYAEWLKKNPKGKSTDA